MIIINKLIPKKDKINKKYNEIDYNSKEYISIINIYNMALKEVESKIIELKEKINEYSGYDLIQNITSRIKSYESIIKKNAEEKNRI